MRRKKTLFPREMRWAWLSLVVLRVASCLAAFLRQGVSVELAHTREEKGQPVPAPLIRVIYKQLVHKKFKNRSCVKTCWLSLATLSIPYLRDRAELLAPASRQNITLFSIT